MKRFFIIFALFYVGCSQPWQYKPLDSYMPQAAPPEASECKECHATEFETWSKSAHGDADRMSMVPVTELRGCGACHEHALRHIEEPGAEGAVLISSLNKSGQNEVCGKCHFNRDLFGRKAINPHDRHSLFMSVGFEGHKRQISCLDCHAGHNGSKKMLLTARAHICYKCHKGAVATMGVFQPINYLTFGKTCQACHTVHGGSTGAKATRMAVGVCVVCHFGGVAIAE